MKTKGGTIIAIAITAYVVLMAASYFGIKKYVDAKDDRLRKEAYKDFENFFSRQNKFVEIAFSGKKVASEIIDIPKAPSSTLFNANKLKEKWEEDYGNLYKMYRLVPKYTSEYSWDSDNQWSGWMLNVKEKIAYNAFQFYQLYPYEIGFIKQSDSWMYNYMPSVQDAVNAAFEFQTTNDKSDYSKCLSDVSDWDIIHAVENEYYEMFSYDRDVEILGEQETINRIRKRKGYFEYYKNEGTNQYTGHAGYMYNGFYKVFNKKVSRYIYQIAYREWDPKARDFKSYCTTMAIILTVLLLGTIIPVIIINSKKKKFQSESLKARLLRMCNPQRFMSPYDEKKVSVANDIYEKLLPVPEDDTETLKMIRKEASSSLNLCFVDEDLLEELIKKANPKNYMTPYDAEKVRIANQIYKRLVAGGLDVDEIEHIQQEITENL